jgi:2-polyprenyl-3-methyl-5-hydroxy-6-metoxy-1,4-benzoquinol methylase
MNKITIREMLRHGLHTTSLDRLLMRRRVARGIEIDYLFAPDRRQVFEQIYRQGIWLNQNAHGALSGAGSGLAATVDVRAGLPALLAQLAVRSLVDVGCGDFTWMQHVALEVRYTGIDVVQSVIDCNKRLYGSAQREFRCIDAVAEPIPTADAVLCREVLFHLSFADARKLLENVKTSGARFLIATSDTATSFNSDIRTGDFRLLNLHKRPFRFPAPSFWIPDEAVQAGRSMGVWQVSNI